MGENFTGCNPLIYKTAPLCCLSKWRYVYKGKNEAELRCCNHRNRKKKKSPHQHFGETFWRQNALRIGGLALFMLICKTASKIKNKGTIKQS